MIQNFFAKCVAGCRFILRNFSGTMLCSEVYSENMIEAEIHGLEEGGKEDK